MRGSGGGPARAMTRRAALRRLTLLSLVACLLVGGVSATATASAHHGRAAAGSVATKHSRWPVSFLTGARTGRPLPNALRFFAASRTRLHLTRSDLSGYRVFNSYTDANNGVSHVYLQQRHHGIDVYGGVASINVARNGAIINLDSTFVPRLAAAGHHHRAGDDREAGRARRGEGAPPAPDQAAS